MRVVFIDTVHEILEQRLTQNGYKCIDGTKDSVDSLIPKLIDAEGIIIRSRFRMDNSFLKYCPKLKFIARSGAGMENIDEEYCKHRKIQLINAPEGNRNAVGEHTLAMLLSLLNKLNSASNEVKNGIWNREANRGLELDGKTVGILGFGNNGSSFVQKLRGFEVEILAYDKYKSDFGNDFLKESSLEEIFQKADIVSFHIPQNEETIFMANDAFFHSFSKNIFLLNLARGKIVQTSALVSALKTGKVLGAGLDVLEYENAHFEDFFNQEIPANFQYLLDAKNVILTPHVGGWTAESYFKLSDVLADKVIDLFGKWGF